MIEVIHSAEATSPDQLDEIISALDVRRGVVLSSGMDYPGRYTRWDIAFVDPPLALEARGEEVWLTALNERGRVPLAGLAAALSEHPHLAAATVGDDRVEVTIRPHDQGERDFAEEERTRQPSIFSVVRAVQAALPDDIAHLGLYGSFGYDLIRQVEDLAARPPGDHRDLVLYLPDRLLVIDRHSETAQEHRYEFRYAGRTSEGARTTADAPFVPVESMPGEARDHQPGEYAALVDVAKEYFLRGDLFEVVPSQSFRQPCRRRPSELFRWLRDHNSAPYGALMNLGDNDFIVSASPEMHVRVTGRRVETCPISGTVTRGADPIEDADQILQLLSSDKDRSELTMCTDVDRNDKSRVCEPESIRIIGRRQIEMYSRVIHTVDHVEGTLRAGYDGLDAFASHMWAVTVTGAPKLWAMRFIDEHERSPRRWYGGAIGAVLANGDVNTGLTIRTIMIKDGVAEVRAAATLLFESDPAAEEAETEAKASAMLEALAPPSAPAAAAPARRASSCRVLLFDHEDSFVHTLAGYFRVAGAEVLTVRVPRGGLGEAVGRHLAEFAPDLAVLSPGPGSPTDFDTAKVIDRLITAGVPIFGVCLGHQAIAEYFGGPLGLLPDPLHGKEREVRVVGNGFLDQLPAEFLAGRYHSIFVPAGQLPEQLVTVATDDAGAVIALQHRELPIYGVQFHPESLMSKRDETGQAVIDAVVARAVAARAGSAR
ncbi:anthranilate synthase component I [Natronosporangium hydrolyticum]|uniref:Anthranilate synthase n=2 Tax=Natronosporangium hydrolyticum TaxID=2811111 RepID=A0A895YQU2_9ACTN|nr:anthranilate synthase component I [Natronosporangium hydrolyticum]